MKGTATPRSLLLALGALAAIAATAYVVGARGTAPETAVASDAPVVVEAPVAVVPVVEAPEPTSSTLAKSPEPTAPAPAEAGMRAYLDPETGEIGGMPADGLVRPDTRTVQSDWHEGLSEIRLPNGAYTVMVEGRMQEYSIVQLDANGNKVFRCVHDPSVVHECLTPAKVEDR